MTLTAVTLNVGHFYVLLNIKIRYLDIWHFAWRCLTPHSWILYKYENISLIEDYKFLFLRKRSTKVTHITLGSIYSPLIYFRKELSEFQWSRLTQNHTFLNAFCAGKYEALQQLNHWSQKITLMIFIQFSRNSSGVNI